MLHQTAPVLLKMTALILFIKYPEARKVKTRLGAEVGFEFAAELYRLFIQQTFDLAQNCSAQKVIVAFEPAERKLDFAEFVPKKFAIFPQEGKNLGQRMLNAFKDAFARGYKNVAILGSDSPTLPLENIDDAFEKLSKSDLVLGPAEDGGYYLIGLNKAYRGLFENIEWSSHSVLQLTIESAKKLQLSYKLLPNWYDVDNKETLMRAAKDEKKGLIKSLIEQHSEIVLKKR